MLSRTVAGCGWPASARVLAESGWPDLMNGPIEGGRVCVAVADTRQLLTLTCAGGSDHRADRLPMPLDDIAGRMHVFHEHDGSPYEPGEVPIVRAVRGEVISAALVCLREPGEPERFVRCTAIPLMDTAGDVTGAIAITHDATDEVGRVREGRSWTHDLIVAVNHELRSPLTTVLGHAELLSDESASLPSSVAESILAIQRGSRALDHVIQQMTDLFGAGGADSGIEPRMVDLTEIVDSLVRTLRRRAARRRVALEVELPSAPSTVSADPERIRRGIGAILGDALSQSPPGSTVRVSLSAEPDRVVVVVVDEGPGIPQQERSGALWAFTSAGIDTPRGRRVGLVVANAVALAHGGRVTVADQQPRGLRVTFDVPRVPNV